MDAFETAYKAANKGDKELLDRIVLGASRFSGGSMDKIDVMKGFIRQFYVQKLSSMIKELESVEGAKDSQEFMHLQLILQMISTEPWDKIESTLRQLKGMFDEVDKAVEANVNNNEQET